MLCHLAGTTEIEGCPGHPIPPLSALVELYERSSLPRRPARVACVALNTSQIEHEDAALAEIAAVAAETGLPTDDPVRFGSEALLGVLLERLSL